ncbi:DUF4349 domain-containing protein [Halobacillus fulvus]|nr:DUF4349 domain-containing protein [Halobacillus fulvus]
MKKWGLLFVILFLAACSSSDDSMGEVGEQASKEEMSQGLSDTADSGAVEGEEPLIDNAADRMMIYEASIELETNDYDTFHTQLEERMRENDAYMVETNISKNEGGKRQGLIRLRVPQPNFERMLQDFEDISENIQSRNISGRDVTQQYVDLESRLAAKEKIEDRLLTFLEEATATEDLIKISQDLERVQSEVEVLKGQMNLLENQSEFSTITLLVTETKVVVPGVGSESLNTWERTKQAFAQSLNGITSFSSWLFVTIVGYSPVLFSVFIIVFVFWWIRRRKKSART